MTFNEKCLLRAMKSAFKGYGYTVAQTESGLVITGDMWGVAIRERMVPNEVKSLIVLHTGKLPENGCAIFCQKDNVSSKIYELAVERLAELHQGWKDGIYDTMAPTRLTMDRYRLWQRKKDLKLALIDPEYQQILDFTDREIYMVKGALYCESGDGIVWVNRELRMREDEHLLKHLEIMQWVPVGMED